MEYRCACYVRVSTENQLENYSIDEQIDRLKAYCKAKDYKNTKFYTDGGFSGGNINRPALQNLLKDIDNGLINIVVVYKLDRLSRSQKDTLMLIEDNFLKNNVDFVSMSENFDTTTPFGRAMIGILSVFAQLEKDQITERFTMGRIGRAKNGFYHGGSTIPTGYDYKNGELIVNDYEALQVRKVFDLFTNGKSICSIQKYMSEHFKNKHGNWSSDTLVRKILQNKIYIGKVKFKGIYYDGNHQPIVSNETFTLANELLNSVTRKNNMTIFQKIPFKARNLLTGKIYCAKCGARFSGEHGNYTCYSRSKTSKKDIMDPNCRNKKWKIDTLDNYILSWLEDVNLNDYYINNIPDTTASDLESLQNHLTNINTQIEKMIDLYQVDNIPIDKIQNRINTLTKEKNSLENIISECTKDNSVLSIPEAMKIRDNLIKIKSSDDLDKKRLYIGMLIERIEIDDDTIDIFLNL